MSVMADCPACMWGDHAKHDPDWGIRPGLLGGSVCCCAGDCAQRATDRAADFAAKFSPLVAAVPVHQQEEK